MTGFIQPDAVLFASLAYELMDTKRVYDNYTNLQFFSLDASGKARLLSNACTGRMKGNMHQFRVKLKLKKLKPDTVAVNFMYIVHGTTVPDISCIKEAWLSVACQDVEILHVPVGAEVLSSHRSCLLTLEREEGRWALVPKLLPVP